MRAGNLWYAWYSNGWLAIVHFGGLRFGGLVAGETVWGGAVQAVPIVKFMLPWRAPAGQKNSVICRPGTAPAGACRGKQEGGGASPGGFPSGLDRSQTWRSLASSLRRSLPSRRVWKTNKGAGVTRCLTCGLWYRKKRKLPLPHISNHTFSLRL